jgi:hypothetical protein
METPPIPGVTAVFCSSLIVEPPKKSRSSLAASTACAWSAFAVPIPTPFARQARQRKDADTLRMKTPSFRVIGQRVQEPLQPQPQIARRPSCAVLLDEIPF